MFTRNRLLVFLRMHGRMRTGVGRLTGTIALALAVLCVLGVLAFLFPEYLTTPELRKKYDVALLRQVLFWSMVIAGGLSLTNILLGRSRWLSSTAFGLIVLASALGGHRVPVGDFPDHTPYVGLDWFILDLLGSTIVFVFIEKLFPLRPDQPVFRKGWQTDLVHFGVNHLLVGVVLALGNALVHSLFGWMVIPGVATTIRALPFGVALVLIVLVADLVQYWMHRAYHEIPLLWRFHAVHHSTEVLDWLAGSRIHLVELLTTRVAVLGPLYVLGFSQRVMDAYIVIVGVQAVLNHANVKLPWEPLRYVVVTPDFHHWHHGSDRAAIDRNYAAHFAFLDRLFGTQVSAERAFPERYGVDGDYMPEGFLRQQAYPFTQKKRVPELAPTPE